MNTLNRVATLGPACRLAQRPAPVEPRATVSLLSKYGKPLPLRALPWRDLNREYWSQGKTIFPDQFKHKQLRALTAFEKTIDVSSMSLDDLIATQKMEPLSESRRSWLTRGTGVTSLAPWDAYSEGSIGETITNPSAQAMLEAVGDWIDVFLEALPITPKTDIIELPTTEFDDQPDDATIGNFGTPYETPDPITAHRIAIEQEQAMGGPMTRVRLSANSEGRLAISTDRKVFGAEMMAIAKSVKRTLASAFGSVGTLDDLHARVDLIEDALDASGVTIDVSSADADEEYERLNAPADPEWHSSYERPQAVIVHNPNDPDDRQFPRNCSRPTCHATFRHRHERITRIIHRSTSRSESELWRQRLFDVTAFELGTDGLTNPLVSF